MPRPFLVMMLGCLLPLSARAGEGPAGDGTLWAVQFADEAEGWAVGDHGRVLHSIDGGDTWEPQAAPTRHSLRAVQFLNPYTGWAVGRRDLPAGGSSGVVLFTNDGGVKWHALAEDGLPGLRAVKFFDEKKGVAFGDGAGAAPAGAFRTEDGGRSWKPIPGARVAAWNSAGMASPESGALVGPNGAMGLLGADGVAAADVEDLGGRSIRSVKLDGKAGVAVGQGGLVLMSNSGGRGWGFPNLKLPAGTTQSCDWSAVATAGRHVYVAGRPGSVILHSDDSGKSWRLEKTGQPLPLEGLFFLDEKRGWAVGAMGTVVRTVDAGKSWTVPKQGGVRAAVLAAHAKAGAMRPEAVAALGMAQGYFVQGLGLTGSDPSAKAGGAHRPEALAADRLHAAYRAAGGSGAEQLWQFPVGANLETGSAIDLWAAWNKLHDGDASQELMRQMVLAIRVWRPDVVLADAPDGAPAEIVALEAVRNAFKQASDPAAFPEQIRVLGLEPWAAAKLYAGAAVDQPEAVRVGCREFDAALNDSPEGAASDARRLAQCVGDAPASWGFQLASTRLKDGATHRDLMQGTNLAANGSARRALPPPVAKEQAAVAEKQFRQARNLRALICEPKGELLAPDAHLAMMGEQVKGLTDEQAIRTLCRAGRVAFEAGRWNAARETFRLVCDRYPSHPETLEAVRWLVRYQASGEARRREELGQFVSSAIAEWELGDKGGVKPAGGVQGGVPTKVRTAGATAVMDDPAQARDWYRTALALEPVLAGFGPLAAFEPSTLLAMNAARRNLGDHQGAADALQRYLQHQPGLKAGSADAWGQCLAMERWLVGGDRSAPAPRPLVMARFAPKRPNLDARFDDPCWADAKTLPLDQVADGTPEGYASRFRVCHDEGFLYLAIECRYPKGAGLPAVARRDRDADVSKADRVEIVLDLDRDYGSHYRFQIDQTGRLAEDCCGDKGWNPRWFVAFRADDTSYSAEVAIPLAELTSDRGLAGRTWAANVTRVIPGKGAQAWSASPDAKVRPENAGAVQFIGK